MPAPPRPWRRRGATRSPPRGAWWLPRRSPPGNTASVSRRRAAGSRRRRRYRRRSSLWSRPGSMSGRSRRRCARRPTRTSRRCARWWSGPRPPSLARGAAVYREQCEQCHGPTGRGDGPKAKQVEGPPPADLTDRRAMSAVSPVDLYRTLTIGVAGTAMPQFDETLSPEDRWAVATYVATLRAGEGTVREGEGLYAAHCAACHGPAGNGDGALAAALSVRPPALSDLAVQGRFSDRDLEDLILGGRPGTPMPGFARALDRDQAARIVAFLRVLPAAERQHYQPSPAAAVFSAVRRQVDSAVALRSDRVAFDAYLTFERVETDVRARNPALAGEL